MVTGQPICTLGYGDYYIENLGGGGGLSAAATGVARVAAPLSATFKNPMMGNAMIQTWLQNAQNATAALSGPFPWGFHGFDSVHVDAGTKQFFGEKGGSLSTSQNGVHFGISTVICWNGATPVGPVWFDKDGMYQDLITGARAQNWGLTDLFPSFGMPAFPVMRPFPFRSTFVSAGESRDSVSHASAEGAKEAGLDRLATPDSTRSALSRLILAIMAAMIAGYSGQEKVAG
jgi:hypothetical protein